MSYEDVLKNNNYTYDIRKIMKAFELFKKTYWLIKNDKETYLSNAEWVCAALLKQWAILAQK